jgi:hypothetical protein
VPVAPSFDDLLEQFVSEAQAQRAELAFADGDVSEAMAHGAGAMADVVLRYAAQAFRDTFFTTSKGDALTQVISDHIGLEREPATAAQVTVRLTRTSGGAGGTIPAGTVFATATGADGVEVRFDLDAPLVVGAGNNGPFNVVATCTIDGPTGNVATGTITRILDLASLFDNTFTVTNLAAAGGGNDVEGDEAYLLRARQWWQTLRRGTLAALDFGARQVVSVRVARATEDEEYDVTLAVSDADGNSTAEMVADTELELENWRAAGVEVPVVGSTPLVVDVVGELDVDEGIDRAVLAPRVNAAIAARIRKQRQGEPLHLDSIKAAGIAVDPDGINAINLTTPSATVTPTPAQVIRPGTMSIS